MPPQLERAEVRPVNIGCLAATVAAPVARRLADIHRRVVVGPTQRVRAACKKTVRVLSYGVSTLRAGGRVPTVPGQEAKAILTPSLSREGRGGEAA